MKSVKRREFINGAFFATLAATSGCARDGGEARGGGNGKCQLVVQSARQAGCLVLSWRGDGIAEGKAEIDVR